MIGGVFRAITEGKLIPYWSNRSPTLRTLYTFCHQSYTHFTRSVTYLTHTLHVLSPNLTHFTRSVTEPYTIYTFCHQPYTQFIRSVTEPYTLYTFCHQPYTLYTSSYWLLAKLSTFYCDFKIRSPLRFISALSALRQRLPEGTLPSRTEHTSLSNYLAVLETMRKENCASLEHLVSGTQKCEVFSYFRQEVQ
jgi:hypothetical protein